MNRFAWLGLGGVVVSAASVSACAASGGDSSFWAPEHGPGVVAGSGGAGGAGSAVVGAGGVNGNGGATSVASGLTTGASSSSTTAASSTVSSTVSSTTAAASSSSGGAQVTWTQIYGSLFGPSSTGNCSSGFSCHSFSKGGFKCGSSAASCYQGFVSAGWISPGSNASSSSLVDPSQSPLCGSLGGNMPPHGAPCPTSSDVQEIKTWLAEGAPDN